MSKAIADIAAERERQITEEGWTPGGDDLHVKGQLAAAASGYIMSALGKYREAWAVWPFTNPIKPKSPREDLVRAGALIAAEIDRLDRAEAAL